MFIDFVISKVSKYLSSEGLVIVVLILGYIDYFSTGLDLSYSSAILKKNYNSKIYFASFKPGHPYLYSI